jgi:threonine/homoserine/homoserine lactone efflux protein
VGASYLIYLGIRQWRSKANFFAKAERSTVSHKQKSNKRFFLEGFFIAVTNPKSILFFTALFPQFINTKATLLPQFLIMTTTFMTMSFIALIGYGLLAKKAQRWFSKGQRMKWFNRTLGSLFALIGVVLLQLKLER